MIEYDKSWYGFGLLFKVYGSPFPRALPFAILATIGALNVNFLWGEALPLEWRHPFAYSTFSFIVGFMLIFRTNFGYQRYWEGCTNLQLMTQRFSDALLQVRTPDSIEDIQLPGCCSPSAWAEAQFWLPKPRPFRMVIVTVACSRQLHLSSICCTEEKRCTGPHV